MHPYRVFACIFLGALLALAGCAGRVSPPASAALAPANPAASCCADIERTPKWFVALVDPVAPFVGSTIGKIVWRKGYLADQPEAHAEVLSELQPLDIVLVSNKGRLSNHTLPGYFTHAAVYLGTEAQLRETGVWGDPKLRPYLKDVSGGQWFIEADQEGVHLSSVDTVLNVDRLAVIRPRVSSAKRRRQVLSDYFAAVGGRFDFHFDLATTDCSFCTELIHRTMPELNLPIREAYGRHMIIPDELAVEAVNGSRTLSFVLYLRSHSPEWSRGTAAGLAADIAADWNR